MHRHHWVIVAAALLAALLVGHAHSCGDDFFFHLQSWFDAASQLRHGNLHPHWNFHAAFNAGEPRFVFYPPISWELGGLFALVLPFSWVPNALTFVAFCIAGLGAYSLVRPWSSEASALLASCVFLANPFMLLDTVSRAAYGQLLATAFFPFLVAAMLRPRVSAWRLGFPLALMWLSNVPLGILGTYLYVLLAIFRLVTMACMTAPGERSAQILRGLRTAVGGLIYGLALPAFFLLPAVYQRRYIRMQDAFLPGLRVTDNFLGHRTLDPVRDAFLLLTQHVAEGMAFAVAVLLALAAWRLLREPTTPQRPPTPGAPSVTVLSSRVGSASEALPHRVLLLVTLLSAGVLFAITFLSAPLWSHLPALWVVQFPWRLLFAFGLCLALAAALLLRNLRLPRFTAPFTALALTAALAWPAIHRDIKPCDYPNAAQAFADSLTRNHTLGTVNEYVVANADNDVLRPDNPPFWLTADPQAFAPGTTPNLAEVDPDADPIETPPDARLSLTPLQFAVHAATPTFLVINLQDYAHWTVQAGAITPPRTHRKDGLITVPVPAGDTPIRIIWRHSLDEELGWTISLLALMAFVSSRWASRKEPAEQPR